MSEHTEGIQRVSRDVTARGVRMRVVEAGLEHEQPVILVHGFLVSHLEFDDIIDSLARRFHVIAPDLVGFGESEKPSPARYRYGIETFAEAIADLVAAYGLGRTNVLGHGMGGAVAIILAAQYGELLTRMVLVDPLCYPFPARWQARLARLPVLGGVFFKQLYGRWLFRSYFQDEVFSPQAALPHERIEQHYATFNTPSGRESAYAVRRAMLDTRAVVARIGRVQCPTLVVWGRNDRIVPAAFALKLVREIPGARLELFDAGHSPHEEHPSEFASVATEFFLGRR